MVRDPSARKRKLEGGFLALRAVVGFFEEVIIHTGGPTLLLANDMFLKSMSDRGDELQGPISFHLGPVPLWPHPCIRPGLACQMNVNLQSFQIAAKAR